MGRLRGVGYIQVHILARISWSPPKFEHVVTEHLVSNHIVELHTIFMTVHIHVRMYYPAWYTVHPESHAGWQSKWRGRRIRQCSIASHIPGYHEWWWSNVLMQGTHLWLDAEVQCTSFVEAFEDDWVQKMLRTREAFDHNFKVIWHTLRGEPWNFHSIQMYTLVMLSPPGWIQYGENLPPLHECKKRAVNHTLVLQQHA